MSKPAVKGAARSDWREARRQAARDAILDAAWELVREDGLASLSLRDLATRAGITTPTVYAYFESKHAIYDALFGQAATEFVDWMTAVDDPDADPRAVLTESVHAFVDFCTGDVARYQLLFQRTIPGFEPSPESYAPAIRSLELVNTQLARAGVTDPRHVDMWTAWSSGLVDQQISNDPGGDRWVRLVDDFVTMFFDHCDTQDQPTGRTRPAKGAGR